MCMLPLKSCEVHRVKLSDLHEPYSALKSYLQLRFVIDNGYRIDNLVHIERNAYDATGTRHCLRISLLIIWETISKRTKDLLPPLFGNAMSVSTTSP